MPESIAVGTHAKRIRSVGLIAWLGFVAACSGEHGHAPATAAAPSAGTTGDHPSNGSVHVDETSLRGLLTDGVLQLSLTVQADEAARGNAELTLIPVQGGAELAHASAAYELAAGEQSTLAAELTLPKDITHAADLVRYNVRVTAPGREALRITRSLLHVMPAYDLQLQGPAKLRAGKPASYRVRLVDAVSHEPRVDTEISLIVRHDADTVATRQAQTDKDGIALFELDAPPAGDYQITARPAVATIIPDLSEKLEVTAPGPRLLLTTDKPLYQPGQTIHLRALALESQGNTPAGKQHVVFEIEDGRGNKVLKQDRKSNAYGIASTRFALASVVNMGNFKLRARLGDVSFEKTVEVSNYVLPKYELAITPDKSWYRAGEALSGTLDARYFFGKQVAGGQVQIEAVTHDVGDQVFGRVMGMTDAQGHYAFSLALPSVLAGIPLQAGNALVSLRVTVTDTAGQVVTKEVPITVAAQAVRLSLVPEATSLVPGLPNRLHLFATDPLGTPIASAKVQVTAGAATLKARTDAFGHAELRWTPADDDTTLTVALTQEDGNKVSAGFTFDLQSGAEHVLVRTDKSVYSVGESVEVQVIASSGETRAYLDWLNQDQAVAMQTLDVKDGVARFSMPLDANLVGENRIEAYVVDANGNEIRAGRTVVVNHDGALRVQFDSDQPQYRPGDHAQLNISVTDDRGQPAVAALGVQIVDEAVFGLIDAKPGLLRTAFELEDAFAKPQYEIQGPAVDFEQLLFEDAVASDQKRADAAQAKAEASLSALRGQSMLGIHAASWAQTQTQAQAELAPLWPAETTRIHDTLGPSIDAARADLKTHGCLPAQYYCQAEQKSYGQALATRVAQALDASDFWGNRYAATPSEYALSLTSPGPDERPGSSDDVMIAVDFADRVPDRINVARSTPSEPGVVPAPPVTGPAAMAAEAGFAPTAANPAMQPTVADSGAAAAPRVRDKFPETLYVEPSIITDERGKASIALDMADSITRWRVAALANSADGKLGGGQAGITVFQDFFVDVNFPAELTRGDQVEFPVVLYNYLSEAQTVRLELENGSWFSALGTSDISVSLAASEVKSVRFPVRVEQAGTQTLTVRAFAGSASDAVARTVKVVPDGQPVEVASSGALSAGTATLTANFPASAVSGSQQLYLDVFPAFLSQAVSGLDSMLRVPSGCFEQTTSTTWPNVLVTRYMEQTKQTTPEIQLKAQALISAGYQRLLTFEHPGGGFSWFGTQDPAPSLSVTAFGLLEFTDMAGVQTVDDAMLARTRSWLANQQQPDGSWPGSETEFFSFGESTVRNTAFVVWALAAAGDNGPEIQRGLDYIAGQHGGGDDAYTQALVANAFAAAAPDDPRTGDLIAQLVAAAQTTDDKVHWGNDATTTCFYGRGNDGAVTATAMATHALLTAGGGAGVIKGALDFLTAAKDPQGNFGSTQASVWALKTLLLAALKGSDGAVGNVSISLDGQAFAQLALSASQSDVMTRIDMNAQATSGDHQVALSFTGSGKLSYNLVATHNVPWATMAAPVSGPLAIGVRYDRTSLAVDDTVTATAQVQNLTAATQNMILVTLGIPPGFQLLTEDLDAVQQRGEISHFEQTGKQLILYLTGLAPHAAQSVQYRLRATMPVRAADGGAAAVLYYQPEQQTRAASQLLTATAN